MRRGLTRYIPIFAMKKMDFVSEFDHVHLSKHVLGANLSQNEVGAVFLQSGANRLCFGIFCWCRAAQIGNVPTFVGRSSAQVGNLLTFVDRSSAQRRSETC